MKAMIFGVGIVALVGCTTPGPSYEKAEVLERIGDRDDSPAWADAQTPMGVEGSDVVFIETITMGGDSRPEACVKAAEASARAAFLRHVSDGITASGQLNESSAVGDPGFESLTAWLSQGKLNGAKTLERYWQKQLESSSNGERVLRLKCSVRVAVAKSELQRQLREAMGNNINKAVSDQLTKATTQFIEGLGNSNSTIAH